jgi:hypothetical protein
MQSGTNSPILVPRQVALDPAVFASATGINGPVQSVQRSATGIDTQAHLRDAACDAVLAAATAVFGRDAVMSMASEFPSDPTTGAGGSIVVTVAEPSESFALGPAENDFYRTVRRAIPASSMSVVLRFYSRADAIRPYPVR